MKPGPKPRTVTKDLREVLYSRCECETGIRYGSYSNEGERL